MIDMIGGSLLIIVALLVLILQRLYSSVPLKELRRLARRGDHLAQTLYHPAAYGLSLYMFLWILFSVTVSGGLLLTIPRLPTLLSFVVLLTLVVVSFLGIPAMRLNKYSVRLAAFAAPMISRLMSFLYPLFARLLGFIAKYYEAIPQSGLYEKEDLLDLLEMQKKLPDNRMSQEDLELVERALVFSSKRATDILRPRKAITVINADDIVGPVLLDQLHKGGQNFYLVYESKKDNIIGTLSMHDAKNARHGGRVLDLVRNNLVFIHEDFTLKQVLVVFQTSGQRMAAVINKFEEFLGVVTLDDLIQELLGEIQLNAENDYDSRSRTAAYEPHTTQLEHEEPTFPEATEVIE